MKQIIEGLIFIAGDEGITKEQIIHILEISSIELDRFLDELMIDYQNRGLQIKEFGNILKMTTREEHKAYYQKLTKLEDESFLSQGALETLAIIAYNGPITRLEIDEIRGVNTTYLVRKLLDRDFIKEAGKSEKPGRPTLYEVSSKFLDYFGLHNLDELPKVDFESKVDEIDLFSSKYTEENN